MGIRNISECFGMFPNGNSLGLGARSALCHVPLFASLPPPPPEISHPLQPPPPPGGDSHFNVLLVHMCYAGLCCLSVTTRPCIAFPILQINHLCVSCDIPSPKAVYGVLCCVLRPRIFSPGDHVWYHSHIDCSCVGQRCGPPKKPVPAPKARAKPAPKQAGPLPLHCLIINPCNTLSARHAN